MSFISARHWIILITIKGQSAASLTTTLYSRALLINIAWATRKFELLLPYSAWIFYHQIRTHNFPLFENDFIFTFSWDPGKLFFIELYILAGVKNVLLGSSSFEGCLQSVITSKRASVNFQNTKFRNHIHCTVAMRNILATQNVINLHCYILRYNILRRVQSNM